MTGDSIVQSVSSDVHRYYDPAKSIVVLEYTMHGAVVRTAAPYINRFISVITVTGTHTPYARRPNALLSARQELM